MSESQVVVVANLRVAEGKQEAAEAYVREIIEQTHAEAGNIAYALHRDAGDPAHLVIIERWASQADLDAHFQQPYMQEMPGRAAEVLAAAPQITFFAPVPAGDPAKGTL